MPMRHGLTMGELAHWFINTLALDVDCQVITMQGWQPEAAPGYGWPLGERTWINPSPNAPNLWMTRCYAGTVHAGRHNALRRPRYNPPPGTVWRARTSMPEPCIKTMRDIAPQWLAGCRLRECWFEPTFHKHAGKLCTGVQIHVEDTAYDHAAFRPWRLQALALKALRLQQPDYPLWRDFPYEYELDRLAIDVINGSPLLREWVDDAHAMPEDLEINARADERAWEKAAFGVFVVLRYALNSWNRVNFYNIYKTYDKVRIVM